jgi:hypothetical protein
MRYGEFPVTKLDESGRNAPSLAVRIRTRLARARLDTELASGADPAGSPELALRAEQLSSPAERSRIATALVDTLGGEPMIPVRRPQRAVVRGAANEILALVNRLLDDRPAGIAGLAAAARLAGDRRGPMHRHGAGNLNDAIQSALAALDPVAEPAGSLHARAA